MSRYFTKNSFVYNPGLADEHWEDEPVQHPSFTVHEDDLETFTGILNRHGQEIHRSEKIPLGFALRKVKA